MKASIKFREDQSLLCRAKFPLTVAGLPLLSGLVVGRSQDLALHLGTFFEAGPSCKISYKPNDSTRPLSLLLKTGCGLWGSSNNAALAMTVEFSLRGKVGPFFSICMKPRVGDFSLRKQADSFAMKRIQRTIKEPESRAGAVEAYASVSNDPSSQRFEKGSFFSLLLNGDAKDSPNQVVSFSEVSDSSSGEETKRTVSDSSKIEGLDQERKGRGYRKLNFEGVREQEIKVGSPTTSSGGIGMIAGDGQDIGLQEKSKHGQVTEGEHKLSVEATTAARGFGLDRTLKGLGVHAHSSLPLGNHAKLNVRWGAKLHSDVSQSWYSRMSDFSISKLPFFLLDKISVESVNPSKRKLHHDPRLIHTTGSLEYEALSVALKEESHELVQIASMCYSMKRQLHLLYAENKFLRRALEEMRAEFEYRGGKETWKPMRPGELLVQEERAARPPLLEEPKKGNGTEMNRRDNEGRKDFRDRSRRESHDEGNAVNPDKVPVESEVCEELKQAIMSITSSPVGEE